MVLEVSTRWVAYGKVSFGRYLSGMISTSYPVTSIMLSDSIISVRTRELKSVLPHDTAQRCRPLARPFLLHHLDPGLPITLCRGHKA